MQKLPSLFSRLALTVAGALALGACNRSEYAMLPKSASYLGTKPAAYAPRPAAPTPVATTSAPVAPVATEPTTTEAAAPVAAKVARVAASKPVAPVATPRPAPVTAVAAAEATLATTPAKPAFAQRLALKKLSNKLDKLAARSPQLKQRDASAHTARISGNLRTGIILLLVGLLVSIFSGLIGGIIALIGVIFLVLWLLDEL